jgi:hypothetical protein
LDEVSGNPGQGWFDIPEPMVPLRIRTNGLAVASMVLGILCIPLFLFGGPLLALLALIFGWVSLHQIKHSEGKQTGRRMAIAGTTLGVSGLLFFVVLGAIISSSPL